MADNIQFDTMDAASKTASDIANDIRAYTAQKLRAEYPWLKSDVLDRILANNVGEIKNTLIQQTDAMNASRDRMGFMKLSAELRNRIYDLALLGDNSQIEIDRIPEVPRLLQLSRQIREEAAPIYYGQNEFRIHISNGRYAVRTVGPWLESIGAKQRDMIRKIVLHDSIREDFRLWLKPAGAVVEIWVAIMESNPFRLMSIKHSGVAFEKWEFVRCAKGCRGSG